MTKTEHEIAKENVTENYSEGIINYDKINDRVQCPICKKEFKALLSSHVPRIHKLSSEKFKEIYGLNRNFGVVCLETKSKHRKASAGNLLSGGIGNPNLNRDRPKKLRKQRIISDTRRIIKFSNSKEEREKRKKRGIKRWDEMSKEHKEKVIIMLRGLSKEANKKRNTPSLNKQHSLFMKKWWNHRLKQRNK